MPISKATAGTATLPLSGAIVILILWAFQLSPPAEVVVAMQVVVSALLTFPAIWFTPRRLAEGGSNGGG